MNAFQEVNCGTRKVSSAFFEKCIKRKDDIEGNLGCLKAVLCCVLTKIKVYTVCRDCRQNSKI